MCSDVLQAVLKAFSTIFCVPASAVEDTGLVESDDSIVSDVMEDEAELANDGGGGPQFVDTDTTAGTVSLSDIVEEVGVRDDIQVGYDEPVEGAYAVTLSEVENGHLVFEDGTVGTKWFMPGDKVYITGVPEKDGYVMAGMSVTESGLGVDKAPRVVSTDIVHNIMGVFTMPDFDVDMTVHFGISELDEVYQPVADVGESVNIDSILSYIQDNVNSEYVEPDGSFVLSQIMYAKYTFADGSLTNGLTTIDDIHENEDTETAIFYQQVGQHPLWDLDEDSEYYVGWLSNPDLIDGWQITDHVFARDNVLGEVVDGCYFDYETGLVYVPKSLYSVLDEAIESGELQNMTSDELLEFDFDYIQCQMLYISDSQVLGSLTDAKFPTYLKVTGNVDMSMFNTDSVVYGSMIDSYLAIPLVSDISRSDEIDWTDMQVFVNGEPYHSNMWSYDSSNGILYVGNNAVNSQFIDVVVHEQSLSDMVSRVLSNEHRETDVLESNVDEATDHVYFGSEGLEFVDPVAGDSGISTHTLLTNIVDSGYGTVKFEDEPTDAGNANYYKLSSWSTKKASSYGFPFSSQYGALDSTGTIFITHTQAKELDGVGAPSGKWYGYGDVSNNSSNQTTYKMGMLAVIQGGASDMTHVSNSYGSGATYWDMGADIGWNTASLYVGMSWQGGALSNGATVMELPPSGSIIRLACSHSSVAGGSDSDTSATTNFNGKLYMHVRVLDVVTNSDGMSGYLLLGFAASSLGGQETLVILKMPWECEPKNGNLRITKKGEPSNLPCIANNKAYDLTTVVFEATHEETGDTVTLEPVGNGVFEAADVPAGWYTIEEVQPPKGYSLASPSTKRVEVKPDATAWAEVEFVNE